MLNDKNEVAKTQVWLLLLRGDHDMNEVKVGKVAGMAGFRFATLPEIERVIAIDPGEGNALWEHEHVGEGVAMAAGVQQPEQQTQVAEALAQRLDSETGFGAIEF